MKRRGFLTLVGAAFVAGCDKVADSKMFEAVANGAQGWHRGLHRALGVRRIEMAPEYDRSEISPFFRGNGTRSIADTAYRNSMMRGFADWRLTVGGMVEQPQSLSLEDLFALPQRTQITRHDCVEGWSAIGEWTGPQLSAVLALAKPMAGANFVVFHCADNLNGSDYYESCDMDDAMHPQTIIAHQLNGKPLPERNGAPLRLRLERQLGYKHAKYLTAIELVASLDDIGGGKGGYWEDRSGYQWYAGI